MLQAQGRDWKRDPQGHPQDGCWYAGETHHAVCDQEPGLGFLTFYRTHGLELGDPGISERESLALWGLPLTEPAYETNAAGDRVLTQWFERARFEYHPDKEPQYRVLLGLLGREAWGKAGRPNASAQPLPGPIDGTAPPDPEQPVATPVDDDPSSPMPPQPSPTAEPTSAPEPTLAPTATLSPTPYPTDEPPPTANPTDEPSPTPTSTPTLEPPIDTTETPSPTSTSSPDDTALKQQLWDLIQGIHLDSGCEPFNHDERLDRSAQAHDDDISAHKVISHVGTDGSTLHDRMRRVGYPFRYASEGIAVYRTPEEVIHFWMDEPLDGPHRQNLINCKYTDGGIGLAYDDRGLRWWVLDIGSQ